MEIKNPNNPQDLNKKVNAVEAEENRELTAFAARLERLNTQLADCVTTLEGFHGRMEGNLLGENETGDVNGIPYGTLNELNHKINEYQRLVTVLEDEVYKLKNYA